MRIDVMVWRKLGNELDTGRRILNVI